MTDNDQSSAAAFRPHRPSGDTSAFPFGDKRTSFWARLRGWANIRPGSLRTDIKEALEAPVLEQEDDFSASERTILQNVLKLGEMRVEDVMVPRADIEAIESEATIGEAVARFRKISHSRMPVYGEDLDDILGMVHIRDVLEQVTAPTKPASEAVGGAGNGAANPVKFMPSVLKQRIGKRALVRKVLFVPPSMPIVELLVSMQATRIHMALVIDEYGGTDGLVTLEDLLEAVVGDIEDEHDENEAKLVRRLAEGVFTADARTELPDLVAEIGADFDPGDHAGEVDTLGGLIVAILGRVPVRGEIVTEIDGFELKITRADARRVRQVRITRTPSASQPQLLLTGPEKGKSRAAGESGAKNAQAAE